jgi:hypothetical protein
MASVVPIKKNLSPRAEPWDSQSESDGGVEEPAVIWPAEDPLSFADCSGPPCSADTPVRAQRPALRPRKPQPIGPNRAKLAALVKGHGVGPCRQANDSIPAPQGRPDPHHTPQIPLTPQTSEYVGGWPTHSPEKSKSHTTEGCPILPRSLRKGGRRQSNCRTGVTLPSRLTHSVV